MSLICLCIADIKEKEEIVFYSQSLTKLADYYKRGIEFSVDWSEPIVDYVKDNYFIINLLDYPNSNNCEMLLLPDGWYHNGYTNDLVFKERMRFLQDIANMLIEGNYRVEFYIGCSGMKTEEFLDVEVKCQHLIDYLEETVGSEGAEEGIHIIVVP